MTPLLDLTRDDFGDWLRDHGAPVIGTIVVLIVGAWALRQLVPRALRPAVERQMPGRSEAEVRRRVDTLSGVIINAGHFVLFALAALTILPEFGFDIRPVLAGVSITGIALGLGAQSLVRDTLNGLFILTENQYARGDYISIAGVSGTVEDVTLRRTVVRDLDGVVHSVPNSAVVVSSNFTRDYSRVRVSVPVAAASDLTLVRRVADEAGAALAADPAYRDRIIDPPKFLRVDGVDMNGMSIQVNGTVLPGAQWEIAGALRGRLLEALRQNGVKTPWG